MSEILSLKALFMGDTETVPIDFVVSLSDLEWNGEYPFSRPVTVKGKASAHTGVVRLEAEAVYCYDGRCDRCLADIRREASVAVSHVLVSSLEREDTSGTEDDGLLVLQDAALDLTQVVQDDILLSLPAKILCRNDCKGLCPSCGVNRNEGNCSCRAASGDPRMAALAQLLTE